MQNNKNNKKKAILAAVVLIALVAVALTCWLMFRPEPVQGSKTVTIEITHGNGEVKEYVIHTDEDYLRGALEQEGLVSGTESQYGMYILTVDGETVDESNQEWWGYTQDGEEVFYGIDSCPIADGDHYEFAFHVGW